MEMFVSFMEIFVAHGIPWLFMLYPGFLGYTRTSVVILRLYSLYPDYYGYILIACVIPQLYRLYSCYTGYVIAVQFTCHNLAVQAIPRLYKLYPGCTGYILKVAVRRRGRFLSGV